MVREPPSQFNRWENRLLIQFDPDGGTDSEHVVLLAPVIARFDTGSPPSFLTTPILRSLPANLLSNKFDCASR